MWSWIKRLFRGVGIAETIWSVFSGWKVAFSGAAGIVIAFGSWLEGQSVTWIFLTAGIAFTVVLWAWNGLDWRRLQLRNDPDLQPDAELSDAIEYLTNRTKFGKTASEDDIFRQLRFAAFDGSITIWGAINKGMRMGNPEISMREKVPKEYWFDMMITRHNLKPTQIETDKTIHEDGEIVGVKEPSEFRKVNYNFLYVHMGQLKSAFPWWAKNPSRIVY